MKYVLTFLVLALASWPYYHRFKSFGKDWNPFPIALLHAAPFAFGLTLILSYMERVGTLESLFTYTLIDGAVFWIVTVGLTIWNAYLVFTAESFSAPDDIEGALVLAILICAMAFVIGAFSSYALVTTMQSLTE